MPGACSEPDECGGEGGRTTQLESPEVGAESVLRVVSEPFEPLVHKDLLGFCEAADRVLRVGTGMRKVM